MRNYDKIDNIMTIDKFSGMASAEIYEWLEIEEAREYIQWEKDEKERLDKEREEDAKYCEVGDKNVVDPEVPVVTEDCIQIIGELIDSNGFIPKKSFSFCRDFIKLSYKKGKVYISRDAIQEIVRKLPERSYWQ
jgi:hypothetical protein